MNKKLSEISPILKVKKLIKNRQVVVFLICLVIASVLWFLNALSNSYSASISYPVKFIGAPDNRFLANTLPSKFELKVEAHGFALLRHKLSLSVSPIVLNLSAITNDLPMDSGKYSINTNNLLRRISTQISIEISITEIQPEILTIVFDSLQTKSIPVKLNIQTGFKPQYNLNGAISIVPEKVEITGPAGILDTLQLIETESLVFDKLDAGVEKMVKIVHPEKTTVSPDKVLLKFLVEKFTEKELNIPIQVKNLPAGFKMKLFPAEVKVSFVVGLSEFDSINAADFIAIVDYDSIKSNIENLAVVIETKPEFIQVLKYVPVSVEFLTENE